MAPQTLIINLQCDAPYVSVEEYAKRSGFSKNYVRKLVAEGKLPIYQKKSGKESTLINLAQLLSLALQKQ